MTGKRTSIIRLGCCNLSLHAISLESKEFAKVQRRDCFRCGIANSKTVQGGQLVATSGFEKMNGETAFVRANGFFFFAKG